MSNLVQAVRDEMRKVARKELRAAMADQKKSVSRLRAQLAALRKELIAVSKLARLATKPEARRSATRVTQAGDSAAESKTRITAKGIRSLRSRLKLTRMDFGTLVGATGQSVYNWEKDEGPLRLRSATRARVLEIRDIGRKDALARLAQLGVAKPGKVRRRRAS